MEAIACALSLGLWLALLAFMRGLSQNKKDKQW